MLPNHWYPIYESKKLRSKTPESVKRFGEELVLWRDGSGTARTALDRCPHRGTKLSSGTNRDGCLTCPYHGFEYDGDGTCVHIPAAPTAPISPKMSLGTRPTEERNGLIWVWWGDEPAHDDIPWLDHAPSADSETAMTAELVYPIHYTRMVESNFDLHHFPFVHGNFAGSLPKVVTDVTVDSGDDWVTSEAFLGERDDKKRFAFRSDLKLPNIQVLIIRDRFTIVTVATPIDDTSTWTWARLEVRQPNIPVISKLISWAALKAEFGYIQYRQDIPVLREITPNKAQPGSSTFIAADAAAARYVTIRQKILDRAGASESRFTQPKPHTSASTSLRKPAPGTTD